MQAFENTPSEKLPELIRTFEAKRLDALRNRDAAAMDPLAAPSFVFIREDGAIVSRADFLEALQNGRLSYLTNEHDAFQYNYQERSLFIIVGLLTGRGWSDSSSPTRRFRSCSTWFRHEVGWQMICAQLTELASDIDANIDPGAERILRVQ